MFAEAAYAAQSAIDIYHAEGHWMSMVNMLRLSQILLHQGKYEQSLMQLDAIQTMVTHSISQYGLREMMNYRHPSWHASIALTKGHYAEAHAYS
jgi:hypothetical protein